MEDYILREIDKIGKLIQAVLQKVGLVKQSDESCVYRAAKVELLEKLNLDIDILLENENFVNILTGEYGFSNDNLEKFAELLFDLAVASYDEPERMKLITGINAVYKYLDKHECSFSLNRYYILKELKKYTKNY